MYRNDFPKSPKNITNFIIPQNIVIDDSDSFFSFRISAEKKAYCRTPRPGTTLTKVTSAVRLGACSHPMVQILIKLAIELLSAVPVGRNQQTIKM